MKFAHTGNNGQILGWYDPVIHSEIPEPNIEVTDEQWLVSIGANHNTVDTNGTTSHADHKTIEEKAKDARTKRDLLLLEEVDPLAGNVLRWNKISKAEQDAWSAYREELLNIPQGDQFPLNITWPNKPSKVNPA